MKSFENYQVCFDVSGSGKTNLRFPVNNKNKVKIVDTKYWNYIKLHVQNNWWEEYIFLFNMNGHKLV